MDVRAALKGQYHAALAMMRQAATLCPDRVWLGGEHPRTVWRVAYHAVFYTLYYLQVDHTKHVRWPKHRPEAHNLWPERNPPVIEPYTQAELAEFVDYADAQVDGLLDQMDVESSDSGFPWYPISKLEHQIVNVRHLAGHVGQISELLIAAGIDVDWVGSRPHAEV
jgi:hypothetical protein